MQDSRLLPSKGSITRTQCFSAGFRPKLLRNYRKLGPWPWTVHGHGQSMAMDCPWPGSERSEPGASGASQDIRYVDYTSLRHRLLYKLTAPFTIQAYGTVYYTSLRHRLLYKLPTPFSIQADHTVDHTSLSHR